MKQMTDIKLFVKLLVIMVGVSIGAGAINTGFLFYDALDARKEILIEEASRYRRALISVVQYHELHGAQHHPKEYAADKNYVLRATANQVRIASSIEGISGDINIIIGALQNKDTGYITFFSKDMPRDIMMGSARAAPMQLALRGKTGTIRERDYKGDYVLAAYTYEDSLGLGIVAKSHIEDIVFRFIKGAIFTTTPALLLVLVGVFFFWRMGNRLVSKLRKDNELYKRMALDLESANKDLAESEERLQRFFDAAFEGIVITEAGVFIDCNKHFAKMFGYTIEEVIGMPVSTLVYPDDLPMVRNNIAREYSEAYEHRSIHKDGSVLLCEVHGQMSHLKGRKVRITAIHDLKEREKKVEAIKELADRKQHASKMEAIGNFASGIAHDFNNTLTPIIGHCDLLFLKLDKENPIHKGITKIYAAAQTAHLLVKRIQTFTRKDPAPAAIIPLRVDACIKEAFEFLRSITPKSIDMEMCMEDNLGMVTTTDVMIRQILMNLVKNSAHAIGDDHGTITIDVSNEIIRVERWGLAIGEYVKIEVEDNGCGMPEEVLEQALDPYYTTKDQEGTGLGLTVVHGILDNHKGLIHLQSTEDMGTKATVYLPVINGAEDTYDSCNLNEPVPLGDGQKILFVDDEESISNMAKAVLTTLQYNVTIVSGSKEALREICLNPTGYDVLMTDLTMPHMSGIELIEEAKKVNPELKTVLSSGLGLNGKYRADLYSNLINVYMQKPVTRREYGRILSELFKKS